MDVTLSIARDKRGILEEAIKVCRRNEETVHVVWVWGCVYGMIALQESLYYKCYHL